MSEPINRTTLTLDSHGILRSTDGLDTGLVAVQGVYLRRAVAAARNLSGSGSWDECPGCDSPRDKHGPNPWDCHADDCIFRWLASLPAEEKR
jgi:hypothetical protein